MPTALQRFKTWLASLLVSPEITAAPTQSTGAISEIDEHDSQQFVPYDENLLERSRTQWQFGDWASLAAISRDTLQHHPDRAKLALLVAAGYQSLGNASEARQHARLAMEWGCSKKLVSQILIAGVHNTLGRAAAVGGQTQRSLQHFEASIKTGMPYNDVRLLTQARLGEQILQLGLSGSAVNSLIQASMPQIKTLHALQQRQFEVKLLANHDLGLAWAGNTVTTVIFRHHGIVSSGNFQFTAFYVDDHTLRLVQRDLTTEHIQTHDLSGQFNLLDAHNSISLGIDRAGHLHMCYDHHATPLRYRRSSQPLSINVWTAPLPMTGVHEDRVTYPSFILPSHGHPLALLYRDGTHNKGSARLKTYDETTQSWADRPTAILSGSEQAPWTSNAYWNHPATGHDGSLHLSFVWRIQGMGEEDLVNNINIGYAKSDDWGQTWQTVRGHAYKLPITQVNAETIHAVAPGSNLINQCSMALDSYNRPHIVFYSNDANGIPQYQHLRFDGKTWHHQFLSSRATPFALQGGGTLQIPISRPEIIIDQQDKAYAIFRGDCTQDRMGITQLTSNGDLAGNANTLQPTATLWDESLGFAEPIVDRTRWQKEQVLTMLLQHNHQPDGDRAHQLQSSPVRLVDFRIY
jgi:hypothetical protein